jgi:hypothetical protein
VVYIQLLFEQGLLKWAQNKQLLSVNFILRVWSNLSDLDQKYSTEYFVIILPLNS